MKPQPYDSQTQLTRCCCCIKATYLLHNIAQHFTVPRPFAPAFSLCIQIIAIPCLANSKEMHLCPLALCNAVTKRSTYVHGHHLGIALHMFVGPPTVPQGVQLHYDVCLQYLLLSSEVSLLIQYNTVNSVALYIVPQCWY